MSSYKAGINANIMPADASTDQFMMYEKILEKISEKDNLTKLISNIVLDVKNTYQIIKTPNNQICINQTSNDQLYLNCGCYLKHSQNGTIYLDKSSDLKHVHDEKTTQGMCEILQKYGLNENIFFIIDPKTGKIKSGYDIVVAKPAETMSHVYDIVYTDVRIRDPLIIKNWNQGYIDVFALGNLKRTYSYHGKSKTIHDFEQDDYKTAISVQICTAEQPTTILIEKMNYFVKTLSSIGHSRVFAVLITVNPIPKSMRSFHNITAKDALKILEEN